MMRPPAHAATPPARTPAESRSGPVATHATTTEQASGSITAATGVGARSGKRCSPPRDTAFAAACATVDEQADAAAATAPASDAAAVIGALPGAPRRAASTAAVLVTRRTVNAQGLGDNNATSPAVHADQSRAAATVDGARGHSLRASAHALPTVNGSVSHRSRGVHIEVVAPFGGGLGGRPYTTNLMPSRTLSAGFATGIGSLPHVDARSAAAVVLRCLPELPAAPQLPCRAPCERMIAQAARALPEVETLPDGSLSTAGSAEAPARAVVDRENDAGLFGFLDSAARSVIPVQRVKVQTCGPLTLGIALIDAGMPEGLAFERARLAVCERAVALERVVADHLPDASIVLWLDEPGLVAWRDGDAPLDRDSATDLLSGALASVGSVTGVHVCGGGDLRIALDAGPNIIGVEVRDHVLEGAGWIGRHLDGGGWIAWGAVPTDKPVGEHATPLWKALVGLWCELTRRGCDPVQLRSQALITPACGLAGHGASQAERAMLLAREIGARVHDQAAATKLSIGA